MLLIQAGEVGLQAFGEGGSEVTFGAGVVDGSVRLRELVDNAGGSERVLELGAEVFPPIVGTEALELATRFELDTSLLFSQLAH